MKTIFKVLFTLVMTSAMATLSWATPAKWVWIGDAGTADNPGDWATTSNWKWVKADGTDASTQPTEGYPSDSETSSADKNGGNAWLPIEISGTADEPVYINAGNDDQLEGWDLQMTLSNAHVTIENLGKIQSDTNVTSIHLTNNSTLTFPAISKSNYQWNLRDLNVGDGCTFKISEQVTNLAFEYWSINLNQTGKLELVGFDAAKSASLLVALNPATPSKVLKTRELGTWTGETNNLNLSVVLTGGTGTQMDTLNAETDITDVAVGSYNLVKDGANKKYVLYYVDYEPAGEDANKAFDKSFDYVFNGLTADYGTLSNWTCYNSATLHASNPPGAPGSDRWGPILVDGKQLINVAVGEDGYKTVTHTDTGDALEGWNLRLGVAGGAHLKVKEIKKFQTGDNSTPWIYVDKDSKLTVDTFGSQDQNVLSADLHIAAPEGLVVNNTFEKANNTPTYTYYLDKEGSVNYKGGLSNTRNHTVESITLDVGATSTATTIVKRPLILFAFREGTQTFSITATGVTTTTGVATSAKDTEADLAAVGDYCKVEANDGLYVAYVANAVAKIGTTTYASFQAALDAATAGQTVTLIANVAGEGVTIEKNVTIDFGGFTYTVDEGNLVLPAGLTVTLKNGTITAGATTAETLIDNAANLTLSTMTVNVPETATPTCAILAKNGTLKIKAMNEKAAKSVITASAEKRAILMCVDSAIADADLKVSIGWAKVDGVIEVTGTVAEGQTAALSFPLEYRYWEELEQDCHLSGDMTAATLMINESNLIIDVNGKTIPATAITKDIDIVFANVPLVANKTLKWDGCNPTELPKDLQVVGYGGTSTLVPFYNDALLITAAGVETEYETLAGAIAAAGVGDTVKLLAHVGLTVGQGLNIAAEQDLTLDLNGYQIRADLILNFMLINRGTLLITNSSETPSGMATGGVGGKGNGSYALIANVGTLTVENLTLFSHRSVIYNQGGTATFVNGAGTSSWGRVVDNNGGSFTQKDGTLISTRSYAENRNGGTYTMEGGTIVGGNYGVYNYGTFNLDGGSISAPQYGFVDAGTLTVSSGSISSSGYGLFAGGNSTITGGTIVGGNYGVNNTGTFKVEGGTISSSAYTLWNSGTANIDGGRIEGPYAVINNATLTMTDGVIDGTYGVYNNAAAASFEIRGGTVNGSTAPLGGVADSSGSVTGGTFSSEIPEEYWAEGVVLEPVTDPETGTTVYVAKEGSYVAQITDANGTITKYATLQAAAEVATAGDTITLLTDSEGAIELADGVILEPSARGTEHNGSLVGARYSILGTGKLTVFGTDSKIDSNALTLSTRVTLSVDTIATTNLTFFGPFAESQIVPITATTITATSRMSYTENGQSARTVTAVAAVTGGTQLTLEALATGPVTIQTKLDENLMPETTKDDEGNQVVVTVPVLDVAAGLETVQTDGNLTLPNSETVVATVQTADDGTKTLTVKDPSLVLDGATVEVTTKGGSETVENPNEVLEILNANYEVNTEDSGAIVLSHSYDFGIVGVHVGADVNVDAVTVMLTEVEETTEGTLTHVGREVTLSGSTLQIYCSCTTDKPIAEVKNPAFDAEGKCKVKMAHPITSTALEMKVKLIRTP